MSAITCAGVFTSIPLPLKSLSKVTRVVDSRLAARY